ncbi:MAG: hypothetical protein COT38_02525 [Candidatus Omnitrophica bacterium CG08_land_8_20_14_0_20_41_16]|nr:MAG: hypothetical protein COT38_02525 [Candidatus Omnitrophica bacterium CG08_land_8_20_14_0_20_41_16]
MRSFVKKTGMPEGSERQANEHQWSPLEKLRLPARGRILLIPKKPFRGRPRKGFLGRDEFFQRIFLHKSQAWVIVGG